MDREILIQRRALPLEQKIILTQNRIKEWYEHFDGRVYVSVSGKDSHVLLDIVRQMGYDVPAVYINTGLEYPEVLKFNLIYRDTACENIERDDVVDNKIQSISERYNIPIDEILNHPFNAYNNMETRIYYPRKGAGNVEVLKPSMSFVQVLNHYGYPLISKEIATNIQYARRAKRLGDTDKYNRYANGQRINAKTGEVYHYAPLSPPSSFS